MRLYEFITTMQLNENFVVAQREFSKSAPELEVKGLLKKFRELGKNGAINDPAQRRIDYWIEQGYEKFKLFIETVDELAEIRNKQSQQLRSEEISNDSVCVFSNDKCDAYIPLSHSASRRLGQGSTWCTSASSPSMWNSYVNAQKHIMFKVISKTNTADNFALRFNQNGDVQEIRDLTQQLPRNDLSHCAKEFTRHTGISVTELWSAAQDKLAAVCNKIDNNIKDEEYADRFDYGDFTGNAISVSDVARGGKFLHAVMNGIRNSARGPSEHVDQNEELGIGIEFAQYINASPLKNQLVRLIDTHWKYVVISSWLDHPGRNRSKIDELLSTGSAVLKNYAEIISGIPSASKEKEICSIKNESRKLLAALSYCMCCTSRKYPASKEMVDIFMDDIRKNGSAESFPESFRILLHKTGVIYPEFEKWLLDACRHCQSARVSEVIDYVVVRQSHTKKPWTEMYTVIQEKANDFSVEFFESLLRFSEFKDDKLVQRLLLNVY